MKLFVLCIMRPSTQLLAGKSVLKSPRWYYTQRTLGTLTWIALNFTCDDKGNLLSLIISYVAKLSQAQVLGQNR
jgi:hypothetical protein